MPHLFTQRPRMFDLHEDEPAHMTHSRWNAINAFSYKGGGLIFVLGSILFFPRFSSYENEGAWLFVAGSLLYLLVTGHDLLEIRLFWKKHVSHTRVDLFERIAAVAYFIGTLMFTAGSLFFLSCWGWFTAGTWLFIVGSVLFIVGASINVMQIVQADSLMSPQLMNLTAMTFVVGSTLFAVASVPFLWHVHNPADRHTLFGFLAWQYLLGSLLFLGGGFCSSYRIFYCPEDGARGKGKSGSRSRPVLLMRIIRRQIEENGTTESAVKSFETRAPH